jgi:hypothetical protein
MRYLILVPTILLVACGNNAAKSNSTAQALSVSNSCAYQGEKPYSPGVFVKLYLCTQFTPACTVEILSNPALDQVPAIVANNCPQNVATSQVP